MSKTKLEILIGLTVLFMLFIVSLAVVREQDRNAVRREQRERYLEMQRKLDDLDRLLEQQTTHFSNTMALMNQLEQERKGLNPYDYMQFSFPTNRWPDNSFKMPDYSEFLNHTGILIIPPSPYTLELP